MIKIAKKLLVMLIVSVFMISMVVATAHAVNTPSDEKIVEHKEKKIKNYKIKWSANGGKIGAKKTVTTTVKKGSKVKLAKTPKRTGYSFQGWFSKKSGGKKITKNTKPTKSITYFAHWKKVKVLNAEKKKLVGAWGSGSSNPGWLQTWTSGNTNYQKWNDGISTSKYRIFHANGKYEYISIYIGSSARSGGFMHKGTGTWSVSKKGTVMLKNLVGKYYYTDGTSDIGGFWDNALVVDYSFGPDFNGNGYGLMWTEDLTNGEFYEKIKK